MAERKQINFTVVPDEPGDAPRYYSNFCALSHTPYDFNAHFLRSTAAYRETTYARRRLTSSFALRSAPRSWCRRSSSRT